MGKDMQAINFVRLHLASVTDENRKALAKTMKGITAEMAVKGLLNSGSAIRARLEAMRDSGAEFIRNAVDEVPEKYQIPETFALIRDAAEQYFEFLTEGLPRFIFQGSETAAGREAIRIFTGHRRSLERQLALLGDNFGVAVDGQPHHSARAPAVKKGWPPDDAAILAKADEMKARGFSGRDIAATMRFEPGFENVATTSVRKLIEGRYPRGAPKKPTQ